LGVLGTVQPEMLQIKLLAITTKNGLYSKLWFKLFLNDSQTSLTEPVFYELITINQSSLVMNDPNHKPLIFEVLGFDKWNFK